MARETPRLPSPGVLPNTSAGGEPSGTTTGALAELTLSEKGVRREISLSNRTLGRAFGAPLTPLDFPGSVITAYVASFLQLIVAFFVC